MSKTKNIEGKKPLLNLVFINKKVYKKKIFAKKKTNVFGLFGIGVSAIVSLQ